MNTLEEFLSSDNYLQVNRTLIKCVGLHEAILLSELLSERRYWRNENRLKDGWFYSTRNNLQDNTGLTATMQRSALQSLKNSGVVEVKQMGLPAKNYYYIDDEQVLTILNNKMCENLTTGCDETLQQEVINSNSNNNIENKNNNQNNKTKRASEPRLSSQKHSRNFQKETKQLTDKLSSGAEIAEQEEKKKKKRSQKELCLDEIEDSKYQFSDAEKVKLTEYLEWAMSGKDNRRIRNVELWRTKLNTLLQLREEGCDLVKVIQNSIEKKWYVFVDEKQEHGKKNGGYRPVLDDKIIIDHAFDTKEKVQAEMQRRKDAGIPSFQ